MKTGSQSMDAFGLPRRTALALDIVLAAAGAAAVAALVLEYGFREGARPVERAWLHAADGVIVGVFVLDRIARLLLARRPRAYFRENWIDFALMFVAVVVAGVSLRLQVLGAAALYVLITQLYIGVVLVLRAVGLNLRFAGSGIRPAWLLIGSFAFLSLAGSGLLMLPVATPEQTSATYRPLFYPDALFTGVSATCVTGLTVRNIGAEFTTFGQAVILALIQFGGLGLMLFGAVLAMFVGKGLSLRGTSAMGQMLGTEGYGQIRRMAVFVVAVTVAMETIGAVLLYPMFASALGPDGRPLQTGQAVWQSVFHSVSSFCNAGFSLQGRNIMAGVGEAAWSAPLREHWQVLGVMAPLIVLGGLGFPVLADCASWVARGVRRRLLGTARRRDWLSQEAPSRARLSLHSRIVLCATAVLIVGGAAGLLLVEPSPGAPAPSFSRHPVGADTGSGRAPDWSEMSLPRRARAAVFQSVTARTAGFNTVDMAELSDAGKLWMCMLMTIGGSPGGTAGGMRTVTVVLLMLIVWSVVRGRRNVEVFRRSLSADILRRVVTAAALYLSLLTAVVLLLSVAMRPGFAFVDLLFESCSAVGTVGLSTGVTGSLNNFGKYVIIGGMFCGRLGMMTVMLAMVTRPARAEYYYPTENVVIG
ncbi:MAG TPA: potassium transporter TrkG [Phycisphaerae bacterium]|nr:potassium transporter TrkG [Phycisphaerae bacterium]